MANLTLNVVSATLYESDSKQYPGTKIKRKLIALKEDARKLTIFRNAANGANFDLIFAGSTLTLDDQSFEANNYTNKQGVLVESLQLKQGTVFLVSGGTPPVAVQPVAPTQAITIGKTPAPTQGIVLGQSNAPVQTDKDKHMDEMAKIRDAWTEKLITALERNTLMMERLLTKNEKRPLTAYPDGITQEEADAEKEPSDEELQAIYDEEGY